MNSFIYLITTLLVTLIVPIVLALLSNRKSSKINMWVYPKAVSFVGFIGLFPSLFGSLYCLYQSFYDNNPRLLIMVCLSLTIAIGCIYLILLGLNWKVYLIEDALVYRNVFHITHKYDFTKITKISIVYQRGRVNPKKCIIYLLDKRITLDYMVSNFHQFPIALKSYAKEKNIHISIKTEHR